jgi:hypothetical protein
MQMLEVGYAVKDHCDYLVGAQETEPGDGWPYDGIIKNWKKGFKPAQVASLIVKEYAKSYNGGSAGYSSSCQSALVCAEIDGLADAINGLSKAALSADYSSEFKNALNSVQKFYYRTNIDLGHFVELTQNTIKDEAYQTAAKKLMKAYDKTVLISEYSGYNNKNATGIAIYFPTSSYSFSSKYKELAFAQECMWEQMVKDYYVKSTSKQVIAEVQSGNLSALRDYVANANEKNRSVSNALISKINFAVFTEGKGDKNTQDSIKTLVQELKSK